MIALGPRGRDPFVHLAAAIHNEFEPMAMEIAEMPECIGEGRGQ